MHAIGQKSYPQILALIYLMATDGYEELRICIAQHEGHLSWHSSCLLAVRLCFWVLQNCAKAKQILRVLEAVLEYTG